MGSKLYVQGALEPASEDDVSLNAIPKLVPVSQEEKPLSASPLLIALVTLSIIFSTFSSAVVNNDPTTAATASNIGNKRNTEIQRSVPAPTTEKKMVDELIW